MMMNIVHILIFCIFDSLIFDQTIEQSKYMYGINNRSLEFPKHTQLLTLNNFHHSKQINKNMQQPIDPNQLQLQIIDSTCLINQKLLRNNAIDGTNIIYLAGASIVFHNIFQNTKKFITRMSDSQVVGMAFLRSTDNVIALATIKSIVQQSFNTQTQPAKIINRLSIELYTLGEKPILLAQFNENTQYVDMQFYQKKKIILLTRQFDEHHFYFLQSQLRIKKKQVSMQNPKRFVCQDRKISVLGERGMKDLDLQVQNLSSELRFARMKIDDYAMIDNEFEVLLSQDQLYCYHDSEQSDHKSLSSFQQQSQPKIQPCCMVHVGRNILIAHKNSITLSHFAMDNGTLHFLNHYTYKEKIKGGIVSMEVSFDQMNLAMAVELVEKETSKIENFMFNLSILSSEKKFINPFIRLFSLGTETAQITSLQGVIPFQTYYLTGNTIVDYTFNESVQKKFKFSLHQTPKQLCAHPLGYQFACIFDNQVKFYIKIQSEIIEVWNEQFICSAGAYISCGQLLIACLENNFYQLILYDTNAFVKIRTIPNVYLKHPVTKIEPIHQDSKVILFCGHDLSIYTLKTGQKIAQFKQKKEKQEILALAYDPESMTLLTSAANKTLSYYKKLEQASWEFKYQKIIPIKQQVTCILINPLIQTIFMGTKSGKILWTEYPLNLMQKQYLTYSIEYKEIKMNQNPVSQILMTNNLKYLFVSFKNQGLVVCKIKKILKYQGGMQFSEFQISNLNFLQTSNRSWMSAGEDKLKGLLQKRKTVFNDLQEYKKQWQLKKNMKLRVMERANKEKELQDVNQALAEVERVKKEKQACHEELQRLEQQTLTYTNQKQQKYQKQILLFYDKNIELKVRQEKVTRRCQQQYATIESKCRENISQIESELKRKYDVFMENYQEMKNNLGLFEKRARIQKEEAQAILLQLFAEKRQHLLKEESEQNQHSNQLKALITKHKKELQRYNSRKYFLEQKKNYFLEQLNFCAKEKLQLTQIKQDLQSELKELEIFTNTKEKRLRKYFKENQILTKYQLIHNNLMSNLNHEFEFIEQQKKNTGKNIISVQMELSQVAEMNEDHQIKIEQLKNQIHKIHNKTSFTAEKTRYLQHIIQEMSESLEKLKSSLNDQNKAQLFTEIYRQFYVKRKLEKVLQSSNSLGTNEQQEEMEYKIFNSNQNKKKTLDNLQKHKKYLEKNMNLFEKHNKKTDEELNLNFLKYQTQNYNLIAECNIRKQQTSKKKRILHELIDSAKETQFVMNQLQKQTFDDQPKLVRPASYNHNRKSSESIPFFEYKRNKQENEKSRIKVLRKQESQPSLLKLRQSTYQVRKMLDIQKVTRPGTGNIMQRRIKTAMIKNRNTGDSTVHMETDSFIPMSTGLTFSSKKPMTATGKRHQAPFGQYNTPIKTKSSSKPTTCTLHTAKNKTSLCQ